MSSVNEGHRKHSNSPQNALALTAGEEGFDFSSNDSSESVTKKLVLSESNVALLKGIIMLLETDSEEKVT